MEFRETGMPEKQAWEDFFDPKQTLELLGVTNEIQLLVDIGSGYGTFLLPASTMISGTAIGIDISPEFLAISQKKIIEYEAKNIKLIQGDILDDNVLRQVTAEGNPDYICLFNILHCEDPVRLLKKVSDLLDEKGHVAVTHWIHEDTPRGPSLSIRPKPAQIIQWAEQAGLILVKQVELPPYHYGLLFKKSKES